MTDPKSKTLPPRGTTRRPLIEQGEAIRQLVAKGEKELAEKRKARARAREIRLQNIRQEQEKEDEADGSMAPRSAASLVRSQKIENGIASVDQLQDGDLEKKFKELNVENASLLNEKEKLKAQVDQLKDVVADLEESNQELTEEVREKAKIIGQRNLALERQIAELDEQRQQILFRDQFLESKHLVLPDPYSDENENDGDFQLGETEKVKELEEQVRSTKDENQYLIKDRDRLKKELDSLREAMSAMEKNDSLFSGPNYRDQFRDAVKQVAEYKQKWQIVDGDKARLEAQVQRFELTTKRLRKQVEDLEQNEEDLKSKSRKSARELRQAQTEIVQLKEDNEHLLKRIENLRKPKNRFGVPD
ncbi:leucine-rich repeat flightless-interacting protein 2-like [Oscarella lobularis]|uniref:leucine-rich repeat flightless-interacting protein 2-like n=1 Tax=Oscarella lobularis TaxID=121494 RepID=UPI0033132070